MILSFNAQTDTSESIPIIVKNLNKTQGVGTLALGYTALNKP